MAPGNNLRKQRRKLTAGLTSLGRQKLTGGKYKNKLMNKQTEWARGGATTYLSSHHRRSSIHHRGGTKLGTINLAQRFVLIWVWMIRKSMSTQCDQVNLCSLHFERLQASPSSELQCCCMEATDRSLNAAWMYRYHPNFLWTSYLWTWR